MRAFGGGGQDFPMSIDQTRRRLNPRLRARHPGRSLRRAMTDTSVRLAIYRHFAEHGTAPTRSAPAERLAFAPADIGFP